MNREKRREAYARMGVKDPKILKSSSEEARARERDAVHHSEQGLGLGGGRRRLPTDYEGRRRSSLDES